MGRVVRSFDELAAEGQAEIGGKGRALVRLRQAGLPVPDGFTILPGAFADEALTAGAWDQVGAQLARLRAGRSTVAFAVRSSAMSEDSAQASFAGEFETVLNVRTDDEVRAAIRTVYRSRQSERVRAYSQAQGVVANQEIAVVVQALVRALGSGVLFTADPITGRRDQAMINAAWGLGEAIVGGRVSPDTLVVDKASGRVLSRETGDKRVMTVLSGSGTAERPVPRRQRRAPVLSDAQAAELVRLGMRIEALYDMPMDIEWVMGPEPGTVGPNGAVGTFAIVQARPITALPEETAPLEPSRPTEWKLPEGAYMAVRNNIVELMADPLSPLFATLGLAAVNASMGRLLADFFGRPELVPDDLIITVNQYAYYNGSFSARQLLRILAGSVAIMRRMFRGAVERWVDAGRPQYVATVDRWQTVQTGGMSASALLAAARELEEAAIDAYGALVSGVIPAAWITEGLFTLAYNALMRRRDDPAPPIYLMGYDSVPIRAEKSLYDLSVWARAQDDVARYVLETPTPQLAADLEAGPPPADVDADAWRGWHARWRQHLGDYGHTIYNLDFANPVPADDPAPLLETVKMYVAGRGTDPHARQRNSAEARERALRAALARLGGVRLRLFRRLVGAAQRYAPLREDGLADVGLAYPLLRRMLRELGHRLAEAGMLVEADDVFWLRQEELAQAAERLDRGDALAPAGALVGERKAAWHAARRATPPRMLPQITLFGVDLAEMKSRRARGGDTLKGVAASPGTVTGPARVVTGPGDFAQMQAGEVLVAALTTPAWTPLFARAAAVVTDIGGPLSHGSIVAREYGIPAVLGTGSATKRIRSGQVVTVDGSAGVVRVGGRSVRRNA